MKKICSYVLLAAMAVVLVSCSTSFKDKAHENAINFVQEKIKGTNFTISYDSILAQTDSFVIGHVCATPKGEERGFSNTITYEYFAVLYNDGSFKDDVIESYNPLIRKSVGLWSYSLDFARDHEDELSTKYPGKDVYEMHLLILPFCARAYFEVHDMDAILGY